MIKILTIINIDYFQKTLFTALDWYWNEKSYFLIGIHSMQDWTAIQDMELQEIETQKD